MGGGSVGSVDFSSDPAQKYIFVADLLNGTVWQLDRQSGEILGHVSHKGPNPGEFFTPHVSAMDSKGKFMSAKSEMALVCRNSCQRRIRESCEKCGFRASSALENRQRRF